MQPRGVQTPQAQLLYVVQWLGEFSDIEKDDFLQELLDLYAPGQMAIGQALAKLQVEDRPPSLFQCRMDLLKQWFESWGPGAQREELLSRIREADSDFFEKFEKSRSMPNHEKVVEEFWISNGNFNGKVNGTGPLNGYAGSDDGKTTTFGDEEKETSQPVLPSGDSQVAVNGGRSDEEECPRENGVSLADTPHVNEHDPHEEPHEAPQNGQVVPNCDEPNSDGDLPEKRPASPDAGGCTNLDEIRPQHDEAPQNGVEPIAAPERDEVELCVASQPSTDPAQIESWTPADEETATVTADPSPKSQPDIGDEIEASAVLSPECEEQTSKVVVVSAESNGASHGDDVEVRRDAPEP